jgi:hypothetical protein
VLARAATGHPVEALALLEDRDPAPAARQPPGPPRFTPSDLLALVEAAGCSRGTWRGVSSSPTCSTSPPAPTPRRSAGSSWRWRQLALPRRRRRLHLLATRP